MTSVRPITVALIDAGDRLRSIDPVWVNILASEIGQDGLQEPIRVVERGDRFRLISGAGRLAAVQQLGHSEIAASVAPAEAYADEAAIQLAEIKADMVRRELHALDHAVYVARWCDLYREAQGPLKRGRKSAQPATDEALDELSATFALNWDKAAQQALQISRRSVFYALKIAAIPAELRQRIALHSIANAQRELILLAEQDIDWQAAIIDMMTAEPATAENVSHALTLLRNAPAEQPKPVYERFHERFVVLKPAEKTAFFDLNAEEIDRWAAQRMVARKAVAK